MCEGATEAQDCSALESDPDCTFNREECLTDEAPCLTHERIYECAMPPVAAEDQFVCDGDIYCIGEACETIKRVPNDEFKDAAVALNAVAQASGEFDPDSLTLFRGERNTCSRPVFGLIDCCRGKSFPLIPGASLLVSLGCDRAEVELHQKDAQGLCAYVGSYCSAKTLGICTKKRKAYCCFESKLSRILQEQGRPQIGKPWDKPKEETCDGFTAEEFAQLDLSRMDFSEVYAEFTAAARLPEELETVDTMRAKIIRYYDTNGG